MLPEYKITDEVRSYILPTGGNLFEELLASVQFEDVERGRQGAVLVKSGETSGIPLVRTTTRYATPARYISPRLPSLFSFLVKVM